MPIESKSYKFNLLGKLVIQQIQDVILLILAFGHYIMVGSYFKRNTTNSRKKKNL